MGFTTGLLGGFTLTASILYLSVQIHTQNRIHQSALLHQQSRLLNNIIEPQPAAPPPRTREVQAGLWESLKDGWNAQLEKDVRHLQNTDWTAVRDQIERGARKVFSRAVDESRKVAGDSPSK